MKVFKERNSDLLIICGFAIVSLLLLIANPGYFNHDELQKLDHIKESGLISYLKTYVSLHQSSNFGVPIRPFSFLMQGGLAYFMEHYPVVVHLFAVLTHAIVGCLVYIACKQLDVKRGLALTISLIFVLNPLGIMATGWSAALMDRWYILFGISAFVFADRYVRLNGRASQLLLVFLCSALSILSKETAVILPALMCIIVLIDPKKFKARRFWLAAAVWTLPIILFMLYRLPALIASFGNPEVSAYKASIGNVPEGLLVYFAYPFLFSTAEAGNWVFVSSIDMFLAVICHAFICFALARLYGLKAIAIYASAYFLFLAPVVLIPIRASHYLYGSSIVLSIGVGILILQKWKVFPIPKLVGFGALSILLAHTVVNQDFIYSLGQCMNTAQISTESAYASSNRPLRVDFQADPGAAEHVLFRMATGRNRIGESYPLELTVSKFGTPLPDNTLRLRMNTHCLVYFSPE